MGALRNDRDPSDYLMDGDEQGLLDALAAAPVTPGKEKGSTPEDTKGAVPPSEKEPTGSAPVKIQSVIHYKRIRFGQLKAAGPAQNKAADDAPANDNGWDEARKRWKEEPPPGNKSKDNSSNAPNKFKTTRYRDNKPSLREEWITKVLLPGSGLIAVYGPPGCGKSFFALHWALHAAAGLAYTGRKTRKVRVVYIAAEGAGGFRKRVKAAGAALELPDDTQFDLIEAAPDLGLGNDDLKLLVAAIEGGAEEGDEPVKIIVIDTLSRSLGGADENGPGMAKFIENCGELSKQFNCAVVFVHHTGVFRRGIRTPLAG